MGTAASANQPAEKKEVIPPWVYTVKIPPEYQGDKLGDLSDGMKLVGPNTVIRKRAGHQEADGVRWSRGFNSGKHTFEIVFPMVHRGVSATVGVSTEESPLHAPNKKPLCGMNKFSWGICLRTRQAYHKGAKVRKYPPGMAYLPDKFYMYLDADEGKLMFGSDLDYYGLALQNLPKGKEPLYPMVCATNSNANITVVYRGKGDASSCGPPPPAVVPAGPQMMSPSMRNKEPPPPPPPTVVSNTHPGGAAAEDLGEALKKMAVPEEPEVKDGVDPESKPEPEQDKEDKDRGKESEKPVPDGQEVTAPGETAYMGGEV